MSEQNNATCAICGKGYRVCNSCAEQKTFQPWRTVTDTSEHYKIYLALHGYTVTGDKETARKELQQCDLNGKDSFIPKIRADIDEILGTSYADKINTKPKKDFNIHKSNKLINENVDITSTQGRAKDNI